MALKINSLFLLYFYFIGLHVSAQSVLESYVEQGVASNLRVKSLQHDYQASIWALRESKRLFGPSIDLQSAYTRNFRQPIDLSGANLPAGFGNFFNDLQTSSLSDGKLYFPAQNQFSAAFNLTQPVYNRNLHYQSEIKKVQSSALNSLYEDFKIELESEIRSSYLKYLMYSEQEKILNISVKLSKSYLDKITQLITAEKMTRDALYRARSDKDQLVSKIQYAANNRKKAQSYFNFLLNRTVSDSIAVDSTYSFNNTTGSFDIIPEDSNNPGYKTAYARQQAEIAGLQKEGYKAGRLPIVQFNAQGGISGTNLSFKNSRLPYGNLQLSLKWNIFNSGTIRSSYEQATYKAQSLDAQYQNLQSQIQQQTFSAYSDIRSLMDRHVSILSAYNNAGKYYEAVSQKFQLGMAGVLDLYDAKNQVLESDLNRLQWYYELRETLVAYQKVSGKTIKIIQK